MKDDLISRKAFDASLAEAQYKCKSNGGNFRFGVFSNVRENLAKQPAVDAVPLDKLCEWLAQRYEPPYALVDIDKLKMPIDFRQQKEIWMNALTKWMEELDDGKEPV